MKDCIDLLIEKIENWRLKQFSERCYKNFEMPKHPDDNSVLCNGVKCAFICTVCKHKENANDR